MSFNILFKFEIDNGMNDMVIWQWLIGMKLLEPLIKWGENLLKRMVWLYVNVWPWLITLKVLYWWKVLLRGESWCLILINENSLEKVKHDYKSLFDYD
jgi:hypothetical protein